jgi:hypothetical protein
MGVEVFYPMSGSIPSLVSIPIRSDVPYSSAILPSSIRYRTIDSHSVGRPVGSGTRGYEPVLVPAIMRWVAFGFTLTYVLASVGWILFGVVTLRAGVYPRAAAILLMVGAVISFVPLLLTEVILAVAIAWLGFELLTGRGVSAERSARVR